MKVKMKKFDWVQSISETELEISEETIYCFQTGVRKSYAIIPQWTVWNKDKGKDEEVWEYQIIEVDQSFENIIQKWFIRVSELENKVNRGNDKEKFISEKILGLDNEGIRSKEQFFADYNGCLDEISSKLANL